MELINSIDTAVFTTTFVLFENKPITFVTHEIEDGAWQFFSDDEFENFEDVARIVGFQEILNIDPSLIQLLEMEAGYTATRASKDCNWEIRRAG